MRRRLRIAITLFGFGWFSWVSSSCCADTSVVTIYLVDLYPGVLELLLPNCSLLLDTDADIGSQVQFKMKKLLSIALGVAANVIALDQHPLKTQDPTL